MSKIYLPDEKSREKRLKGFLEKFQRKVGVFPVGTCPLTIILSFIDTSKNQTCGKCVPCRDGLFQLSAMLKSILEGNATMETLDDMRNLASFIRDSADCAIGYKTAEEVLESMEAFKDEYEEHIKSHRCPEGNGQKIPCVNLCPAHVDIPAYIALIGEGDYEGAVKVIRKDNPLPTSCAMICEHPCEDRCRRNMIDDSVNIRGLKKYAVDNAFADRVPVPKPNVSTGKKIAVIGGGPAGLTASYFLGQMGHKVVIFERHDSLGGMLKYGIPNYRFPKDRLMEDVNAILSAGDIEVKYNCSIDSGKELEKIRDEYNAVFIAVGAQKGKGLRLPGVDARGVFSAVEMLDRIGNGDIPDYSGKAVVVVGGGNVAMDAARSAIRCNAKEVRIVYRRRRDDMTALDSEIDSAVMEGIELITLQAPVSVTKDSDGNAIALVTKPQMIGPYDRAGRPAPMDSSKPEESIPCDIILMAIGQDVEATPFEELGITVERGAIKANNDTTVDGFEDVFAGGDCATGPATAIRAIAAGKVAAHNIDEYLGYHHKLSWDVETPDPRDNNRIPTGRANITERPAYIRKHDFLHVENPYTHEEAMQEAGRCLRCDYYGCGVLKGGRD